MLEFSDLVHAIHDSVDAASQAVINKHHEYILQYFEHPAQTEKLEDVLESARSDLAGSPDADKKREIASRLLHTLQSASSPASPISSALQPKRVAIDYPCVDENGPKLHTVHVPLLALAPISSIRLAKVRFSVNMHLVEGRDGRLLVDLSGSHPTPSPSQGQHASTPNSGDESAVPAGPSPDDTHRGWSGATTIHIELEGGAPPDGVKKLIEGFERALRAQIPG